MITTTRLPRPRIVATVEWISTRTALCAQQREEPRVQQHNRYDYQYDSHGNWTERVGSYRIGSQPEFQRSNIERRTITYYEL
jgi:hypothetical protein